MQIRQYANYGFISAFGQPIQAWLQQGNIAPKAVDNKAFRTRSFALGDEFKRAHQLGKYTTLVNIADEEHRAIGRFGEAHVGNIIRTQIDLGGATGPFGNDYVIAGTQVTPCLHHRGHRLGLVGMVIQSVHIAVNLASQDYLGTAITLGLEQYRIHIAMRGEPAGQCLKCRGTADFTAVDGNRTVQGHVLGFERRYRNALPRQPSTQGGDDRGFAGIGSRSLYHQRGHG